MGIGRWIGAATVLSGGIAAALLAGIAARREPRLRRGAGNHRLLLLRTNALHTDIAIPATSWVRRRFAFLNEVGIPVEASGMTHIMVGWGSEGFYPNNAQPHRISPLALLHSIIGDDSVLRLAALAVPEGEWSGCEAHPLTDEGLEAIVAFVERTLERGRDGRPEALDHPGIVEFDHFYKAKPTFAALAGCNVWVAEALAEAGIAAGRWTPIPQTLTASIRYHRR